ncbi:MAG: hypothetical protein GC180_03825 [Bacteroidetes bacterium]|nr:hypothetical protein [Bacteroidota bacterium]
MKKAELIGLFLLLTSCLFGQTPSLMLPIGHTDAVNFTTYSPDGTWILSASKDGTVKVWESESGREVKSFPQLHVNVTQALFSPDGKKILATNGIAVLLLALDDSASIDLNKHLGRVNHMAFSPDGKWIATACQDKSVRIFDAQTGTLVHQLNNHSDGVRYVEFSPDSKLLASASWDQTIVLCNFQSRKVLHILDKQLATLNTVHFSPDGKQVIASCWDRTARIYNVSDGVLTQTLEGHQRTLTDARWSPDGKFVVTASLDSTCRIWDAVSGNEKYLLRHAAAVTSLQITPNSRYAVSGDKAGQVAVYDLAAQSLAGQFSAHDLPINTLAIHPIKPQFVTASSDYTLHVYHLDDLRCLHQLKGRTEKVFDIAIGPENRMAAIHQDSIVRILDIPTGRLMVSDVPGGSLEILAFSHDGKSLAAGGSFGMLYVIDAQTGHHMGSWSVMRGEIRKLAWSPDDSKIYVAGDEPVIRCVGSGNGREIGRFEGNRGPVIDMHLSNAGTLIISGGYDSSVTLYHAESGDILYRLEGFQGKVYQVRISEDEKLFLAVAENSIYIHNTEDGERKFILNGHDWYIHDIEFSPNSNYVLSAGADNKALMHEMEFGRLKWKGTGNGYPIYSLNFNPNGTRFALAGGDQIVHLFDTESGTELAGLQGHFAPLRQVEFTSGGDHLISIGRGHQTVIWDLNQSTQLYSRLQMEGEDWLLYDADFHFDGSPNARKMLFVVCGMKTYTLDQLKDALYVPNLARLRFENRPIEFPGLKELDVCSKIPLIHPKTNHGEGQYEIIPGKSSIKGVEIYINNRLAKTIPADSLEKKDGHFILNFDTSCIGSSFIQGQANTINLVAVSSYGDKDLKSRRVTEEVRQENHKAVEPPRLFAIIIGINQYKEPTMRLTYPVSDAKEFGKILELTAIKFLGKENVSFYHLNTEAGENNPALRPERANVQRVFAEIGTKARPQDVVLLFFAGHGEMKGLVDQKYTLLTAEATRQEFIGISTVDLKSWLSQEGPYHFKANKTVLIFDACNSGQANKELQASLMYVESNTHRIRQLEDLKDKAGLVIMSACSPDQSAYEKPMLEHGLLTYCLLKSLKSNTTILEDRGYLNLTRWFDATENELKVVSERYGEDQNAQPFGTTNLCIGFVTDSIRELIELPINKPMVLCSDASNKDTYGDNLHLKDQLNDFLRDVSEKADNPFEFARGLVSGAYEVKLSYQERNGKLSCLVVILLDESLYYKQEIVVKGGDVDHLLREINELLLLKLK